MDSQEAYVHEPAWLTVAEVAVELRVNKMTVYRMIQARQIAAMRFGKIYRIFRDDLDAFIAEHTIERQE